MKILFAASECVPFIKTGGLADVVGALPEALLKNSGQDIQIIRILPKYSQIEDPAFSLKELPGKLTIPVGEKLEKGSIWEIDARSNKKSGVVKTFFIGNEKYFNRSGIYSSKNGDFEDNDERFIFFSRAALEFCKWIDFKPDIIHCHDWQTGLIPAYLKTVYNTDAFFQRTDSVFTVHNIAYQGNFSKQTLFQAGFSWHEFTPEKLEFYGQMSFLKAGLVYADKITTVSPSYAQEIQDDPKIGCGMEGILKSRSEDLSGILNGIDETEWNPAKDRHLAIKYSSKLKDVFLRKQKCKMDLQKLLCIEANAFIPVIGMVSRLDIQKGIHRLNALIPALMEKGRIFQCVVLGLGDRILQELLKSLAVRYPNNFIFHNAFNNELSHKIYAGSDIFFMPSEFEPCGLAQIIAMKYGTIPVVSSAGGLKDTVLPFTVQTEKGTGFVSKELSDVSFQKVLEEALQMYQEKEQWAKLVQNAMTQEFSWRSSSQKYLNLYQSVMSSP